MKLRILVSGSGECGEVITRGKAAENGVKPFVAAIFKGVVMAS